MAKWVFTGDPRNRSQNPSEISFGGLAFPLNTPVDVDDPAVVKKLEGNSHFKRADEATREERSGNQKSQADDLSAMDKDALLRFAEREGIEVDKRYNADTLRGQIEEAIDERKAGGKR